MPEEITARRFLVSLRGYDREEVHAFLGQVAEQVGQLQRRVSQLETEASAVVVRPETPASAESETEEAGGDVDSRSGASSVFAEIGRETQRILEAADTAAAEITRRAQREADTELQQARRRAAQYLAEGERRLEAVESSLHGLESSKTTVAGELRDLQRTIERILRELAPSDEQTLSVREALVHKAREGLARDLESSAADRSGDTGGHGVEAHDDEAHDDEAHDDEAHGDGAGHDAASGSPQERAPRGSGVQTRQATVTPPVPGAQPGGQSPVLGRIVPTDESQGPAVTNDEEHGDGTAVTGPHAAERSSGSRASVAGRTTADEGEVSVLRVADRSSTDQPAERPDPHVLRSEALRPLHPKVVRRIKRGLQDLQNIVLDKVRRSGGSGEVDDLLFGTDDVQALGTVVDDDLDRAYRAGVAAAGALVARTLAEPTAERHLAEEFVSHGAERIRSPLAATLRMGLGSENARGLGDRVAAVFGELRTSTADELAATHLIRAYEVGLLDAWTVGDVPLRQWVLGKEPRCPEARCRLNDQAGAVAVGEVFPSGHEAPPIHVGCTCTTIPILES